MAAREKAILLRSEEVRVSVNRARALCETLADRIGNHEPETAAIARRNLAIMLPKSQEIAIPTTPAANA